MFVDSVVLAGVVTVGLMVAFLGGVALFIWRDSKKKRS
ncbi:cytochrome c oxidase subunit CcoM [Pseudomonas oligotrophica]|nr:cytochrome c oxidase subunit CcoM [Pseudomonas oligotrophica]